MAHALTLRALNRATLARQLLLRREALEPVEAVRRVFAIQAQEPASPYIALWNRVAPFDPDALHDAFRSGSVVKASLMRITLHAVTAADYSALHLAMQPTLRAARLNDRRFRVAGLQPAEADALIDTLRSFAAERPRTNQEMEAEANRLVGARAHEGIWWAIRTYGPFHHAESGGPWTFGPRPAYRPAPAAGTTAPADPEAALETLLVRYLEGFGPATAQDMAAFALVWAARVRPAVDRLLAAGAVVPVAGPGRAPYYDVPGGPLPDEGTPAPPRLLPMWDSVLLAHADRERVFPAAHRRLVTRSNGDTLPAVLVDGLVAGVWRPNPDGGAEAGIEVTAFERLDDDAWAGLEVEAAGLVAFLAAREPRAYARFGRWFADLPMKQRRVLGVPGSGA